MEHNMPIHPVAYINGLTHWQVGTIPVTYKRRKALKRLINPWERLN